MKKANPREIAGLLIGVGLVFLLMGVLIFKFDDWWLAPEVSPEDYWDVPTESDDDSHIRLGGINVYVGCDGPNRVYRSTTGLFVIEDSPLCQEVER